VAAKAMRLLARRKPPSVLARFAQSPAQRNDRSDQLRLTYTRAVSRNISLNTFSRHLARLVVNRQGPLGQATGPADMTATRCPVYSESDRICARRQNVAKGPNKRLVHLNNELLFGPKHQLIFRRRLDWQVSRPFAGATARRTMTTHRSGANK
jgi:hypothetical protein